MPGNNPPQVFVNIPADSSGDVWHAAAILALYDHTHIVITKSAADINLSSKESRIFASMSAFFKNIGFGSRVRVINLSSLSFERSNEKTGKAENLNDTKRLCAHAKAASKILGVPVCPIFHATIGIMHAVNKQSKNAVVARLQAVFTHNLDSAKKIAIDALIAEIISATGNLPFHVLNMRAASYHPFDNTEQLHFQIFQTLIPEDHTLLRQNVKRMFLNQLVKFYDISIAFARHLKVSVP